MSEILIQIPKCCQEGSDDCPHVINLDKRTKLRKNIAL